MARRTAARTGAGTSPPGIRRHNETVRLRVSQAPAQRGQRHTFVVDIEDDDGAAQDVARIQEGDGDPGRHLVHRAVGMPTMRPITPATSLAS